LREELHRYLGGILMNLDCQPIIVGGVEDHVHLLCALSRTCNAAEMVKEVKRSSSLWIKTKSADLQNFAWQNGYGIFSVGFSQIESVREYIAGQDEHHRKVSFEDEFRQFLKRYEIEFDERYVWD
jgi:putative transposase